MGGFERVTSSIHSVLAEFSVLAVPDAIDGEPAYVRPLAARHLGLVGDLAERAGTSGQDAQSAGVELVARMITYCLTDEHGTRVYQDDDVDVVLNLPASRMGAMQSIAEAAMEHSDLAAGQDGEDDEDGEGLAQVAGN